MFTKIVLLSAASVLALVASANTYMGTKSQGCCSKSSSCCQVDMTSVESTKSPCVCSNCSCSQCLPDDCCCPDCCSDGVCCDGAGCDCCGDAASKLVSTTVETCESSCCSKK